MPRPQLSLGIHHVKLATKSLSDSLHFYTDVLGAVRVEQLDHRDHSGALFAHILELPLLLPTPAPPLRIEIRLLKEDAQHIQTLAAHPFNTLTLSVANRTDVAAWAAWLDECGVANSGVLRGLKGWVLVCDDSQGNRLRFYADGGDMVKFEETDAGNPWLD